MTEQQKNAQRDLAIGGLSLGAAFIVAVWLVPLFFPCAYHGGTVATLFGISRCADGAVRVRQ